MDRAASLSPVRRLMSMADAVIVVGMVSVGVGLYGFTEALRFYGPQPLLGEWGAIELTQLGLLVSALCVLGKHSSHHSLGPVVVPLMLLLGAVTVRELDAVLDQIVHGFWKFPAWTLALSALYCFLRNQGETLWAIGQIRRRRTIGLFAAAAFVIFIQSRLLGRQVIWEAALGEQYVRTVPRLVEELTELAGYGLLLIACLDIAPISGKRRDTRENMTSQRCS